jgi:hypothetical protein
LTGLATLRWEKIGVIILARRRFLALAAATGGVSSLAASCGAQPFTVEAAGPFFYPTPAGLSVSLDRLAIVVTITSHSSDDLQVSPADFASRDRDRRLYVANASAAATEAGMSGRAPELRGTLPLPVATMRQNDVLTGYVVFDVPPGVRPVELIWRQTDSDYTVPLTGER